MRYSDNDDSQWIVGYDTIRYDIMQFCSVVAKSMQTERRELERKNLCGSN